MKGLFRSGMRGRRGGYHTPVGAGLRWVSEGSKDLTQRTQRKLSLRLLRAGSAVVHPGLHRGHKFRTVERRQCASFARIPAPANQIVRGNMLDDLRETAMAVLRRIFQLPAKLGGGFALNHHLHIGRRQRPFRIARRHVGARKIRNLMARAAFHPVNALAIRAALHILNVHVTILALQRRVAGGMAIAAARRSENGPCAIESSLCGGSVRSRGAVCCGGRGHNRMYRTRRSGERGLLLCERWQTRGQDRPNNKRNLHWPFLSEAFAHVRTLGINPHAERKSSGLIGSRRTRLPVAAKIAFATAGATGGTPGSPTPVGCSVLGTMNTSIVGDSNMRTIG